MNNASWGCSSGSLSNGTLKPGGYLFWDNPDAGLDAEAQEALAQILAVFIHSDIQVFATTHNHTFADTLARLAREVETEPRFITLESDTTHTAVALAEVGLKSSKELPEW